MIEPKITGVMPLRNATKLGYPIELSISSLVPICDEVVIGVDPTSEDDTLERVRRIAEGLSSSTLFLIIRSEWDRSNHRGHAGESEIARQTSLLRDRAHGRWILSLQADEVMHELDALRIRSAVEVADTLGITGLWMMRYYFFGGLHQMRDNWTVPLLRLFRKDLWTADGFSGAMQFVPVGVQRTETLDGVGIYHYSRIGDPRTIARRVRNLDTFYHDPEKLEAEADVEPYDFTLRKLDTFERGRDDGPDPDARLVPFPLHAHPAGVLEHFGVETASQGGV